MARVGNSIIKGIEVSEIIAKLNRAYADEWLAYYQYFIESKVSEAFYCLIIVLMPCFVA